MPAKCAIVESFNRTLKQYISRLLQWKAQTNQSNPKRYIDYLPAIVDLYNKSRHSKLHMKPIDVTPTTAAPLYHRIYHDQNSGKNAHHHSHTTKSTIMISDFVRVLRKRKTFTKGTMQPRWSDEIFRVSRIIKNYPHERFELHDLNDQPIKGRLYAQELQKI